MVTILIADDYPNIRDFLKRELEEEGYRVLVARDGMEAVEVVQSERPDLAILDLCMPRADGFEAAERIVAIDPGIPVILFTNNDELCIRDPRSALAVACVDKGEDLTELKRAIVSILARNNADTLFRPGLPPIQRQAPGMSYWQQSGAVLPQPRNR